MSASTNVLACISFYKPVSLYKTLMVELDFNNQIGDTLTRFCDEKIFIMADIKYMFHQLMVLKEDKSLSRSLFREKNDIDGSANDFDIGIYLHPNTV